MMGNDKPVDLITTSEARSLLGVSAVKMAQLIKDGVVRHFPNPLDKRVKFVSKREVLLLRPRRAEAA
jgi:hypothetical protein